MCFLICSITAAPFWICWGPSSQNIFKTLFPWTSLDSLCETQECQGGNSDFGWQFIPRGQFASGQLWPLGGLIFRLCSLPFLISWNDDMPGIFQEVVILPSLQLNERL